MKKVLIVDDSSFVRKILSKIISQLGYTVDTAKDGEEAVKKILHNDYDLVTLDIEMPVKNGIEVLKEIMDVKPTRVVIISSYTTENADITFKALDMGAITYITKPGKLGVDLKKIEEDIKETVKEVSELPLSRLQTRTEIKEPSAKNYPSEKKYILIGASTGGPKHIEDILKALPENYPNPICIVQHMPKDFIPTFVKRLNSVSKLKVTEAKDGEPVDTGKVIIGKGGYHLNFEKKNGKVVCRLKSDNNNSLFVPSVDEMFKSALKAIEPEKIVGVLLTGIGSDGAEGLLELRKAGAITIAESEETAIVYGMPREAYNKGAVKKLLPFPQIIKEIIKIGADRDVQKAQSR
ncbi:two-component system, chemotaxis family, response regulator CheB [Persephonella hydrogeniphila]|uniref:Protein-glutamate methylesterase/protein-glutamine glutaminase n=1 Tax=Persephonella hydrogeniphila TaxID=198703 RepID=A0A285N1B1_9AQUI|nr:chemotaxis-specific protein-glutamate methyltransferase CheB [Persephonella hydrogeniphila]SNZ03220.1 two-component system, chemotaxis family, response regulator CheB [Persephonella hydrogeniphila]